MTLCLELGFHMMEDRETNLSPKYKRTNNLFESLETKKVRTQVIYRTVKYKILLEIQLAVNISKI